MNKRNILLGKKTYYKVAGDNEWVECSTIHACCDCGLVHRVEYRISHNPTHLEWKLTRDIKRTAALRRGRKTAIAKRIGL